MLRVSKAKEFNACLESDVLEIDAVDEKERRMFHVVAGVLPAFVVCDTTKRMEPVEQLVVHA